VRRVIFVTFDDAVWDIGRSQEFVSEPQRGTKEWVLSPAWSIHIGTQPLVGLVQSPPKPEKYAENLIQCLKFHAVQTEKFSAWQFRRGTCPLPFPMPLGSMEL